MAKKSFSLKGSASTDKKISLFAMVSIALLAIFNFQNVIDNYVGLGLSASVAFIIAIVLFLFPFIFIIAEFASLYKGTKSGLTSWIKTSVGRKTAFLTSFMFWFANLTYFFSAVPQRLNYLPFALTGVDYTENELYNQILPWVAVGFFFIITLVSTLNTKRISKITSLGGGLMIGLTAFFFVFAIIGWIAGAINPDALTSTEAPGIGDVNIWGDAQGLGFGWISSFIWVLMAADGGQTLGVYVNDVKGGKKTFVRAMLISVTVIGFSYVLGTILTSVFPPVGGLGNGWANSFANLFQFIAKPFGADPAIVSRFSNVLIGSILFVASIGGLIVWTSAPVKVMFSEISSGIFGQKLAKENKYGVCSFGAWVQFLIVVPLMLFLMLSKGDVSKSLILIKDSAGWIGLLPWLVIFVSYVNLRIKKDYEQRSFRMGNRVLGASIGIVLSIITIIILFLTFFDRSPLDKPYSEWPKDWYLGAILKLVMIILILVPAYLWYYFKFEYQIRDVKIAKKLNISENGILFKYNFISKLKYKFLYALDYQEFENNKNKLFDESKLKIDKIYDEINKIQSEINVSFDKEQSKKLKQNLKQTKSKIREEKKLLGQEIKKLKIEFNSKIKAKSDSDKVKFAQEYDHTFVPYIAKQKMESKKNKSNPQLKKDVIKQKNEIKDQIKKLKSSGSNTKEEIRKQEMVLREKLDSIRIDLPYKELLLEDVNSSIIKDIDFDDKSISDYFAETNEKLLYETSIVFDYGFFSKKDFNDKVAISKNKFLIVKNNGDILVGREYELKNMKMIVKAKNKSIRIIKNGEWINLDKIEFIHVENSQIESFNLYVPNCDEFIKACAIN